MVPQAPMSSTSVEPIVSDSAACGNGSQRLAMQRGQLLLGDLRRARIVSGMEIRTA